MKSGSANFAIVVASQRCRRPRYISVAFSNKCNTALSVHIARVQVSVEGVDMPGDYRDTDFKINAGCGEVDRHFRIDLDPHETRDYSVAVDTHFEADVSFSVRITALDNLGNEVVASGRHEGSTDSYAVAAEQSSKTLTGSAAFALIKEGVIVRTKQHPGLFRIAVETGQPNDFGIFNKHELNPHAAYTDIGASGYMLLKGKFADYLTWDRDTLAYPPGDLHAVHIVSLDAVGAHGWVFRTELIMSDADGNAWAGCAGEHTASAHDREDG